MDRLKIGVVGIPFNNIPKDPYNYLIGNRVRTWALFDLLKGYNHETYLYLESDIEIDPNISKEYGDAFVQSKIDFIQKANSGFFDYVLLASTKLELIFSFHPWLQGLKQKNVIGVFCYFNTTISASFKLRKIARKLRAVGFITPLQKIIWDNIFQSVPSFIITTGQVIQKDLKLEKTKDTIFIGEFRSLSHLEKYVEIARGLPDRKHYVVTSRIIEQKENNKVYLDLVKKKAGQREKAFYEFLTSLNIDCPLNFIYKDIQYGMEKDILDQVGVGIDFSWNELYEIENTKVNRYLSYGICPVVEMPSPSYRYLRGFHTGEIINYNESPAIWIESIKNLKLPTSTEVNEIRKKSGYRFEWDLLANEIDSIIQGFELLDTNSASFYYRLKLRLRKILGL